MKKVAILFIVLLTSSFLFAQNTYVPDDKFEQALIDLGYDTTLDDYVLTANISGVTELDVNEKEISDLTGIEGFTALTHLGCYNNKLTSLDVSKNTALQNLQCFDNQLTTLDLSKNTALVGLSSGGNKLTALDVSSNTALTHLDPSNNQLTSLDVSSNTALTFLECSGNQLTSLDVSSNTALEVLSLDDNQLTSLDVTNNSALIDVVISHNQMTSFNVTSNTALTKLTSYGNKLTSLDVSNNTALTELYVDGAELTTTGLDVSNNTALTKLYCGGSRLTSLDVTNNTALTHLQCYWNKLTSLDVSKNTALINLDCSANQLTSLDVSNNTALIQLFVWQNQLTSLDVSKNVALENLTADNNKLTNLDVSANTSLEYLNCDSNQLDNLDVSANTALIHLQCNDNQLTSLDVSNNTALEIMHCWGNQLTSLDVSKNTVLTWLHIKNNQLTYLNMRNGVTDGLTTFDATDNSSLTCIETLDPTYATANWTNANNNMEMDAGVTFSVICGAEAVTKWYVDTTGSDASGSGTLASPLATIQTGINAATDGDTVSVAAGTFVENVFLENPDGGVRKNISVIGENKNTTIIDGNQNGSVFHIIRNGSLFLKNFTIQNGAGHESAGGGVKISGGTAVLENLIIKDNAVGADGGGVWSGGANLTIKYSKIISNAAGNFGGGIIGLQTGGSITLKDVYVENNTAMQGGGIYAQQTPVYFSGTVSLLNNHASTEGGGISFDGATPNQLLTNLVIADNTAGSRGAGIVIHNSSFSIKNSTIVNNKANGNAGGLFVSHGTVLDVDNSIFWNNSPQQIWVDDNTGNDSNTLSFSYSDVQGGESGIPTNGKGTITWGTGNIDKSPLFVDSVAHNFNLKNWSPLIGVGKDGNDIGAFENEYSTPQNAPPVLTALSDFPVNEDASITVTLEAINADSADNDVITFSSISDTSAVIASVSSSTLTLTPNANWHGDANITIYASDGTDKDSTVFKLTVTPVQDAPTDFEWVSGALDTINITQSNLAETYALQWDASTDVDGETINYLLYAQIGVYPAEEISDTTSLSVPITYQEILEGVFEGSPINGATVRFNVKATDGVDTVDVTGDNRVIHVNRYDYLSTESEGVPTEFALHENYPNPFNPTTTLRFDLPEVSNITLTIFNMLGQKIRTYDMQSTPAGHHALKWNATNDYGDPVGAGVYLYQLQSKDFVKTRKMVLLK